MGHLHREIDFVVEAFIVFQNEVLLVLHRERGKWLPIGGHIELNEDPEEALFREIKEECGLKVEVLATKPSFTSEGVKPLFTPSALDIHHINSEHRHIGLVYYLRATSDIVKKAVREHSDIRWFAETDLDNSEFMLAEDVKFYAREALRCAG